jgi:hypothetical protein
MRIGSRSPTTVLALATDNASVKLAGRWNRRRAQRRPIDVRYMRLLVLLLAVAAAGCSSGGHATPQLTARVVLPSRIMAGGSSMTGRVVVGNDTGRAIHVWGCQTLLQVALTSSRYRPTMAWLHCRQRFTIPAGRSSYRLTVVARYLQCSKSLGATRACLPDGRPPPLPPGHYRAMLFQSRHLVQVPHGIPVEVTAFAVP